MSNVSQVMLRHYEKLGLLTPELRGGNNYRYYSIRQMSDVSLILTMQELGMSLKEIKTLKDTRTPEHTVEMLELQIKKIDKKLRGWGSARELISTLIDSILSVREADTTRFSIQYLSAARILLGERYIYAEGEEGYDALVVFYESARNNYPEVDFNRPIWGLFGKENLKLKMSGKHTWPDRFYFYTQDGHDKRPEGFYAVGFARGGYGRNDEIYASLRDFIAQEGYEVCGDAYEEYPLNEISITDEDNYLMRVMIAVREKKSANKRMGQ